MPLYIQKMMHRLTIGLVGVVLSVNALNAGPANCTKRTIMVEKLNERFGESRQSVGLTASGQAIELFANPAKGTWTILLTFPNGTSCMMASGNAYQALNEPAGQGA